MHKTVHWGLAEGALLKPSNILTSSVSRLGPKQWWTTNLGFQSIPNKELRTYSHVGFHWAYNSVNFTSCYQSFSNP